VRADGLVIHEMFWPGLGFCCATTWILIVDDASVTMIRHHSIDVSVTIKVGGSQMNEERRCRRFIDQMFLAVGIPENRRLI
jgi:hypothetical protein